MHAMACKCVYQSRASLLKHTKSYDVIQFVDEIGLNFDKEHRLNVDFYFELPFDEPMHSSANGLIFLCGDDHDDLILCNPITRDYIKLPCPRQSSPKDQIDVETFGFGVSKLTGQYKVVRIFGEKPLHEEYKNECQVYTVGTGSWRKVPSDSSLWLYKWVGGVFLSGKLYWTVKKATNGSGRWISCFDLETEVYSAFPSPPYFSRDALFGKTLSVLRDCLCVSDLSLDGRLVIWLMNEDDQCFTKELIIIPRFGYSFDAYIHVWPIRLFENGDAFIEADGYLFYYSNTSGTFDGGLFCYSNKSKTIDYDIVVQKVRRRESLTTMYASSFLSLKSFVMENVSSF
ncbi:putative F-box/kelch-repeat protein At1g12870 [Salvia hispanica]|uniref:putative F-box/kelch-repeat protein At1g12870 n=1 Tax=Salvia hispanica TaxID=49212 RepID=UPI002009DAA7|nr:putative F-box/kelch-repeat protein At1g12870 [Salvia hispanica]